MTILLDKAEILNRRIAAAERIKGAKLSKSSIVQMLNDIACEAIEDVAAQRDEAQAAAAAQAEQIGILTTENKRLRALVEQAWFECRDNVDFFMQEFCVEWTDSDTYKELNK